MKIPTDILLTISWREVARTYFNRPAAWLHRKLDGTEDFTPSEKEQLKEALYDLSALMKKVADDISTDK